MTLSRYLMDVASPDKRDVYQQFLQRNMETVNTKAVCWPKKCKQDDARLSESMFLNISYFTENFKALVISSSDGVYHTVT